MSIQESEAIKHYTNPKRGFWGKSKMLKKYRETLNKVYALQRHREVNSKMQKKLYKREGAIRPFFSVQIDLADFPKLQNPLNNNIRYLMIVADVFSRYLWVVPLKTKKNLHIPLRNLLNKMKQEHKRSPANMTGDNEFDTRELKQLANQYNFRWWYGDPNEKYRTGIVERVIRTLRNLLKRYLTQNDTTKYIDVLDDLVWNYNNTEHSHIRTKPAIALKTGQSFPKPMKKDIPVLKAGDMVRVLMKRQRAFDKGDKPYYSKEVYEVIRKDGNKYVVRNMETGEPSQKTYYIHQLLHIKGIIKDKTKENDDKVGYDEGIEHKTKQQRNKRALRDIDINNIIDEDERKESARALHYNDDEVFVGHDKPLPKNMSNKQLEKKQKQLEEKVDKAVDDDIASQREDADISIDEQIKQLKQRISQNKKRRNTVKRLMKKIKNLEQLKNIKMKNKKVKPLAPIRRSRRVRKKPQRYGYDT